MAIAFVASSDSDWQNASSVSPAKPVGLAVGNLMVGIFWGDASTSTPDELNPPAGWTTIAEDTSANADGLGLYYKVAVQADVDATSFTFTCTRSGSFRCKAVIVALSDADATSIVYSLVYAGDGWNGAKTFTPGVTPTRLDSFLILTGDGSEGQRTFSTYLITTDNPATWTERSDSNTALGSDMTSAVATAPRSAVTATGVFGASTSGNVNQSRASLICISSPVATSINSISGQLYSLDSSISGIAKTSISSIMGVS